MKGEIFGFIGPNGAGKSTTIRLLLNFIYPTSGNATVFSKDIVKYSKEIRQLVGYLPSEIHYYDDMKVVDLLRYSANFHKKLDTTRMKKLADRLDLDLTRKIEDLSFGNRKKVGIVQAIIHEPKLLILDEPTGGLDPLMQNTFFELLQEERDKGATIFFSSHVLSEVQKTCDRVAIIKEGSLVKVESVETLTHNKVKNVTITLIEFLLSKPLTRSQIITQKLLVVMVNILILNAFVTAVSLIAFQFSKDADIAIKPFMLLVIAAVLLHLTFASVSFALSALMKKTRSIVSISLGIVLGSYFLNIMSGVSEPLEYVKYASFFKYVDAADIVKNNAIDALYISIMVAVILVSFIFAYVYYRKKDIVV
jgi:ABC-type multidrug transport system ATPase subunit